jgi:hypothetical protein
MNIDVEDNRKRLTGKGIGDITCYSLIFEKKCLFPVETITRRARINQALSL